MDLSAYREIQRKNITPERLKRDLEYAAKVDELGLKAPNKIPTPLPVRVEQNQSQSNNPPSVKQPGGTLPKATVPKQLGIGFNQPTVKPQPLPYANKVSSFMPQVGTPANVQTDTGYVTQQLPYYNNKLGVAQAYKDKAESLKAQVQEQQRKVRPWQGVNSSMLAATNTKTVQNLPKGVSTMGLPATTVVKTVQQIAEEQKLSNLKGELAQAQNAGYMADYSQQWKALDARPDGDAIKQQLARVATLRASIDTDYGQNVAAMTEWQSIRGQLEKLGINADGLSDWLQRNADVYEAAAEAKAAAEKASKSFGSGVVESAKTVGQVFGAGNGAVASAAQGIMNARTGEYRPINIYGDAFDAVRNRQVVRGTVGENIAYEVAQATGVEGAGKVAKFLYDGMMSGADSTALALLTGGVNAGIAATGGSVAVNGLASVVLGSSAASETVMDVVERGGSTEQAITAGMLAGVAEAVFEKVSIDSLLDKFKSANATTFKKVVKNAILQGVTEATEEGATELTNILTDKYVMGSLSNIEQMKQAGMSDAQITGALAKQVGAAALAGMLMGVVGGGAASTFNRTSMSLREQRAIKALNKKYGTKVNIEDDIDGANAQYAGSEDKIDISVESRNNVAQNVSHEVSHAIKAKNAAEWNKLYEIANANLSENARARLEYTLKKSGYTEADMQEEVVAHYVQECIADISKLEELVGIDRNLAQKIVDALDEIVRKITNQRSIGSDNSKDSQDLREIMGITPEQAQQTLEQMKKALAAGGQTTLENAQQQEYTETMKSDVRYALKGYWHSNLTKDEMKNLSQLVKSDIKTSQNNINERANWYSTRINGQPVFAIYSTEDTNNPTVLYAEKGARAKIEQDFLKDVLEDIENGKNFDGKSATVDTVLSRSWVRQTGGNAGSAGAVGGGSGTGNVGVLRKQSGSKPSAALKSVLQNIFKIRESDRTVKYSRKLNDQELVKDAAEAAGYNIRAYHGTGRADRVGNVFLPERATSGPMAFFTDSREIAENYARDKKDTSLAYDEEYSDYYSQFRVNRNGKSIKVQDLWNRMTPAQKQRVMEAGRHITWDDDMENIVWDNSQTRGLGNWDSYILREHRGNAIEALIDAWLESGELWNREGDFLNVLELAGITGVEYRDPEARYEKVYDTYLNIQNPFDTTTVDEGFLSDLEAWWEAQDQSVYDRETAEADWWDKNSMSVERWLEKARDDVENGSSHAWTSIPDAVTDYLKSQGYDGIKDRGGKNGGEEHTVYIPFAPEQIKSAETVTMDDNGNVIPLENRFDPTQRDIRFSRKLNQEALQEMVDWKRAGLPYAPGYIPKPQPLPTVPLTRTAEMATRDALPYNPNAPKPIPQNPAQGKFGGNTVGAAQPNPGSYANLQTEHGVVEPGENPARMIDMPKKDANGQVNSLFARTVAESESMPNEMVPEWEKAVASGAFSHEVATDKAANRHAERELGKGWDHAMRQWNAVSEGTKIATKNDLALGQLLLANAMKDGDTQTAMKLTAELCAEATRAGQAVQSFRLLKKMTPEGMLYYLQKTVNNLNEDFEGRKGFEKIKIDEGLAERLTKATTREEMDAVVDDIKKDIAAQTPVTWYDKWNAWRYVSMLGNPTTQVRNILGNALFLPVVKTKNLIATGIEAAVKKTGHLPYATKAVLNAKKDKSLLDFADKDFDNVVQEIQGGGKYSDKDDVLSKRQIFRNKFLEGWRTLTNKAMDKGDEIFSHQHYKASLAQYMKANNLTPENITPEQLNKARSYAVQEAQRATYRDASSVASLINRAKRTLANTANNRDNDLSKRAAARAGEFLLEGFVPFTKTPVNIVKRGIEYSPVGLVHGTVNLVRSVRGGDVDAAVAIDRMAAGLTGSGLLALGAWLASLGMVSGGPGEDDREEKYKGMLGGQDYALDLGDSTYTIDWLAPEALPFFTGVELYKEMQSKDGISLADTLGLISAMSDPIVELSMLSSMNNTFESLKYTQGDALSAVAGNLITSYLGQGVPTIGGKIARTLDETSRQTYYDPNKTGIIKSADVFRQKVQAKIPGAANALPERVDLWGRTEKNTGGNIAGRFFYNMLSPGYAETKNVTKVDEELLRLAEATSDSNVYPEAAAKTFKVSGETIKLNSKQYAQFAKTKGQTAFDILEAAVDSSTYKKMTDAEKAEFVKDVYEYANAKAKAEVSKYQLDGKNAKIAQAEAKGIKPAQFLTITGAYDKDGNGSVTQEEAKEVLDKSGLTKAQKAYLWKLQNKSWKNNPYN